MNIKLAPAALILIIAAPAIGQYQGFETSRSNAVEAEAKRQAAVDRCAASVAGMRSGDEARRFDIAYVGFQSSGIRVFGNVSFRDSGAEEFTCDVDRRGKIRKVQFG